MRWHYHIAAAVWGIHCNAWFDVKEPLVWRHARTACIENAHILTFYLKDSLLLRHTYGLPYTLLCYNGVITARRAFPLVLLSKGRPSALSCHSFLHISLLSFTNQPGHLLTHTTHLLSGCVSYTSVCLSIRSPGQQIHPPQSINLNPPASRCISARPWPLARYPICSRDTKTTPPPVSVQVLNPEGLIITTTRAD
jgi:hypothetical protein